MKTHSITLQLPRFKIIVDEMIVSEKDQTSSITIDMEFDSDYDAKIYKEKMRKKKWCQATLTIT